MPDPGQVSEMKYGSGVTDFGPYYCTHRNFIGGSVVIMAVVCVYARRLGYVGLQ